MLTFDIYLGCAHLYKRLGSFHIYMYMLFIHTEKSFLNTECSTILDYIPEVTSNKLKMSPRHTFLNTAVKVLFLAPVNYSMPIFYF